MQPVNSATVARRRPMAGRNSGSGPSLRRGGGSMSTIRRSGAGQQPRQPRRLQQPQQAQFAGRCGPAAAPGEVCSGRETGRTGCSGETSRRRRGSPPSAIHRHAERLDQLAVLHAGGARRFARPAIEAQLQVPPHAVVQLQLAVGHAAHQIDAPARAVVLVARLDVRRARRRAQPAVDAVEQQLVVERSAGIGCARFRVG